MVNFEAARRAMVNNQIHPTNVTDRAILAAMGRVPRERFVPRARRSVAYCDTSHPFGSGRSLAAPAQFARLLQLAGINAGDRVLDIGALSGYSTAVLAHLGREIVGIESDPGLAETARGNLAALELGNAKVIVGALGEADGAFDVIVVEGAVAGEPVGLFPAMAEGGRLVALIQTGVTAVAHIFVRAGTTVSGRAEFNASVQPATPPEREERFEF